MEKILKKIKCYFLGHNWTCKASKGIKPEPDETFQSYAQMFCDRCGHKSLLNSRLENI